MKDKITLKKTYGHLKTVFTHKRWVMHYCFKLGLYRQGITHDLSKFSPVEFWEGARYYQGTRSPIDRCKEVNGYSNAWFHHKGRNRHHYEYWFDNLDHGGTPVDMPFKYKLELLADYLGAGRAYNGKNFTYESELQWWQVKKSKGIAMHPNVIKFLDNSFTSLVNEGDKYFTRLKTCRKHST